MSEEQNLIESVGKLLNDYVKAADLPPWEKMEFNAPTKATGFTIYMRRTDQPEAVLDHLDDKIALCLYVNRKLAGDVAERPELHSPFILSDDMNDEQAFKAASEFLKGGPK